MRFIIRPSMLEKHTVAWLREQTPGTLLTDNHRVYLRTNDYDATKKDKIQPDCYPGKPWRVVHGPLLPGELEYKADNEFGKIRKVREEEIVNE